MITRRKVTISLKQDLYDRLKENKIKTSTLVNKLIQEYFDEKENKSES